MSSIIRILAIAPYPSMKPLLANLAEDYPNVDLTITVGDLKNGLEIAKKNFHSNYDVIISRGGTAKLIQQSISLPVIEISTSAYDILHTLKLSDAGSNKVAVVGFPNITEELLSLKEVLPYKIDIFTINSTDEASFLLQQLNNDGYPAILCDMITYTTARELGMNAFLITSGIKSIRTAFDTAILYCSSYNNIRNENHFLRQLILGRDANTVVFTKDGKLFYSTLSDEDTAVLDILRERIDEIPSSGKRRFLQRQNSLLYSIYAQRITSDGLDYIAFYFTVSKPPMLGNKCGINYSNQKEVEKDYFNSIYIIMDSISQFDSTVNHVNQNFFPIIIFGEEGTGKEQIAKAIYLRSSIKDQPFVQIDCTLLSEKIWDYLLNHHNSPLCDAGNTIFIRNINALSEQQQSQLLIAITDMEICKRNRVIFSYVSNSNETQDSNAMTFVNRLHCFTITLPSLRDDLSRLDSLVKLYLNRLNIEMAKQILGASSDAMQMLRNFSWPYNYVQFNRIMRNLVMITTGSYINSENAKEVLSKESKITTVSLHSKDSSKTLDISRPLSEISKEVAKLVLEANNGNQSKAAQSLGISRTTLWRIIKSE